jgi:ribosomal peptide maturation radical SAM protein 1
MFPDPLFEPTLRRAYRRLEGDLAAVGPVLGRAVRDWVRGLRDARRPWVYLSHPRAFPLLYLPWFAEEVVAGRADPAFQEELLRSSLAGYFHIRLVDDSADAADPAALSLLPALGPLHLLWEAPYRAAFPDGHGFHADLARLWNECAEATLRDGRCRDIDAREYARASARKTRAALIPIRAVLHRHGRMDLAPAWTRFVQAYGLWHQMDDDVFDWDEDLDHGKATYFTSEARRRAGEAARGWIVQQGLAWGFQRLDAWWEGALRAARVLGSPSLDAYLAVRLAIHRRQRADARRFASGILAGARRVVARAQAGERALSAIPEVLAGGGDALVVVPPFAQTRLASLGAHLLQACAVRAGFRVRVLYGNLSFAARMGIDGYDDFCADAAFVTGFPGERVFARAAHGLPAMGRNAATFQDLAARVGPEKAGRLAGLDLFHPPPKVRSPRELQTLVEAAEAWIEDAAEAIASLRFPVVGCSTSFDTTNAGIALLRAVKRRDPACVTILGGSNCFGEMAGGVASLDPEGRAVDFVFEGESEHGFVDFLAGLRKGERPAGRVVPGRPVASLDDLPTPDYADFEAQAAAWLPPAAGGPRPEVVSETSRGCWRGERGHCTFCGLNGSQRAFRRKSAARAAEEIGVLGARHPGRGVFLADTIVPGGVLGPLADLRPRNRMHLCAPPRIGLRMAARLAAAGARQVEPGFEALDTSFLVAMNKGATAAEVIRSLRNLRCFGLHPFWNLLWGMPGEDPEGYDRTVARMPLLHHLAPPRMAYHVSIDRACPYHLDPGRWGIRDLRPLPSYGDLFPEGADLDRLACHYVGTYDCAAYDHPGRVRALLDGMDAWREAWAHGPPVLRVFRRGAGWFLEDTRPASPRPGVRRLAGEAEARRLLSDGPEADGDAVADALVLPVDGQAVGLATAAPGLLDALGIGPETRD